MRRDRANHVGDGLGASSSFPRVRAAYDWAHDRDGRALAAVSGGSLLPSKAGPVPDRLTIWPVDDGRYGLDATFEGATGYERAQQHRAELEKGGVPHTFRQERNGSWTLRFGPLPAADVGAALGAFVY